MIASTVRALMARFGQRVEVLRMGASAPIPALAFLQPIRHTGQLQHLPTPLGLRREDQFLYLGEPEVPLDPRQDRIRWSGQEFEIQSAHPIYVGSTISHWWAVLVPQDYLSGEEQEGRP